MRLKVPPPIVLLIAVGLLYLGSRTFASPMSHFAGQAVVAAVFAAAGVVLDARSVIAFLRRGTTVSPVKPQAASTLVVTGFYRLSRNPMYLGLLCLLLAAAVYLGTLAALVVAPGFVWFLTRFQIEPEEDALEARFGAEYRAYKARVRRWL